MTKYLACLPRWQLRVPCAGQWRDHGAAGRWDLCDEHDPRPRGGAGAGAQPWAV